MKPLESKWLVGLLLTACFMLIGLVVGTLIGGQFVPEGSGLAGPAIAIGYGFVGALVALGGGVFLGWRLSITTLLITLKWVGGATVLVVAGLLVRAIALNGAEDEVAPAPLVPTEPINFIQTIRLPNAEVGIGLVMPHQRPGASLYFYGQPGFDRLPSDVAPTDSLTFTRREHYIDIATAPPWFAPVHMKMDYNVLMMRALTISRNWVEVEVNQFDGRRQWIDRHAVRFVDWPTFLAEVNSIEALDPINNPIRTKPLPHAAILADSQDALLRPLAVRDEWVQVSTNGLADRIPPTGWIRWRNDDGFSIRYALFE